MLYIPFRFGRNGQKISYQHANRYEAPPCSTSAKISARLHIPAGILFWLFIFIFFLCFFCFCFCVCFFFCFYFFFFCFCFFYFCSASSAASALLLLLLLPPSSLSVSVPLVDCPKNYCNFTACNEKPKQLSINFYLYGQLMLPLFKWAAKF